MGLFALRFGVGDAAEVIHDGERGGEGGGELIDDEVGMVDGVGELEESDGGFTAHPDDVFESLDFWVHIS
jgi:hypothetical protein